MILPKFNDKKTEDWESLKIWDSENLWDLNWRMRFQNRGNKNFSSKVYDYVGNISELENLKKISIFNNGKRNLRIWGTDDARRNVSIWRLNDSNLRI